MFSLTLHAESLRNPQEAPPTPKEKRDALVSDLALLTIALGVATLVLANCINPLHLHPAYAIGVFGSTFMVGWATTIVADMPVKVDTDRLMK